MSYNSTVRSYTRVMRVDKLSPTEFEEVEVSEIWPIKRTTDVL
jgi:hypothetical protein